MFKKRFMPEDEKKSIISTDENFRMFVVEKLFSFENRVSKVEVKASIFGSVGGILAAFITMILKG